MVLVVSLLGGGAALEMRRRRKKQQQIEEAKQTENLEKQIESLEEDIKVEKQLRKQAEERVEELSAEKIELCKENKRLQQQNAQLKISGSYLRKKTKNMEKSQTQQKSQTLQLQSSVRQLEQKNKEKDKQLQELTVNLKTVFQQFRRGKITQQVLLENLKELGVEILADEQDLNQQLQKEDCVELNIDDNWQHKLRFSLDLPDRMQRLAMSGRQQSLPSSLCSTSPPTLQQTHNQDSQSVQKENNQSQINQDTQKSQNLVKNLGDAVSEESSISQSLQTQVKNILNQSPSKSYFPTAKSFDEKFADYQRRKSLNNMFDKYSPTKLKEDGANQDSSTEYVGLNINKSSPKVKFSNKIKQSDSPKQSITPTATPTPIHTTFETNSQVDIEKIRQRSKQLRQKLIQNSNLHFSKSTEHMYDNSGDSFGSYLGKWMKMVDNKSPQKSQSKNQVNIPTSQFGSFQIKDFDEANDQQSKQMQRSSSMQ